MRFCVHILLLHDHALALMNDKKILQSASSYKKEFFNFKLAAWLEQVFYMNTMFENHKKCLIFENVWAKRATLRYLNMSFHKEIGILMGFVARKSVKIGEIENRIRKRHLPISIVSSVCMANFDSKLCSLRSQCCKNETFVVIFKHCDQIIDLIVGVVINLKRFWPALDWFMKVIIWLLLTSNFVELNAIFYRFFVNLKTIYQYLITSLVNHFSSKGPCNWLRSLFNK